MPDSPGEIEKYLVLVPLDATKAEDLSMCPVVVRISDPAETTIPKLTVIEVCRYPLSPSESVATTVSTYGLSEPATVASTVMTPVDESMVMPEIVGVNE